MENKSLNKALLVALIFIGIGAWFLYVRGTHNASQATQQHAQQDNQIVYITKTGQKYHRDGCQYLAKSKIQIPLKDAISDGYGPCSVCNPPTVQIKEARPSQDLSITVPYHQSQYLEDFLPAHSSEDQIIRHTAYSLKYNEEHEQVDWAIYFLAKGRVRGTCSRTKDFRSDPKVKTGSASLSDYKGSGYDRGHFAPAGDMKWSNEAMSESFYMSNMSPQKPGFNRGIWKRLELLVRTWATDNEEIFVVTGPVLSAGLSSIGQNNVAIPEYYYKVVLDYKEPELKGIGFILPNQSSKRPLKNYAHSIDFVERRTGIDFFPAIPDSVENVIESRIELTKWF